MRAFASLPALSVPACEKKIVFEKFLGVALHSIIMARPDLPTVTDNQAALALLICNFIQHNNITVIQFLLAFLLGDHEELRYRRRFWGQPRGVRSMAEMALEALRRLMAETPVGRRAWQAIIIREVR